MNDKVNLKLFLPTVSLVCVMCVQCTPLFFICICQLWQVALLLFLFCRWVHLAQGWWVWLC
jgi:hypothetical protein